MPRLFYLKAGDTSVPEFIDISDELNLEEQWQQVKAALDREFGDNYWEHVTILYNGRRCHMFVDENGRFKNLSINPKATLLYQNIINERHKKPVYNDVMIWEPPYHLDQNLLIVGNALFWTGELQ